MKFRETFQLTLASLVCAWRSNPLVLRRRLGSATTLASANRKSSLVRTQEDTITIKIVANPLEPCAWEVSPAMLRG
jgi:hypothetical protein